MNTINLTAENFVPNAVLSYLGHVSDFPTPDARIKGRPRDFRVEEVPLNGPSTTVGVASDLTEDFLAQAMTASARDQQLTAVTLVKSRMTSFTAQERLAKQLGVRMDQITYAGLKDYKAETSQLMVVRGLPYEEVLRQCCPEPLSDAPGYFIKDARPVTFTLEKGNLQGNRFTIKVEVPGMSAQAIEEYIKPVILHLAENGHLFPNAYGRQRLGRRQNLLQVAKLLIEEGPEAAIKRFLTETSPNEQEEASRLRLSLLEAWQKAEVAAKAKGESVAQQHFWFDAMRSDLRDRASKFGDKRPKHEAFNMTIEYQIVLSTLKYMDFDLVMADLKDAFSLWIGAYQGFWFNQVLAKLISGEVRLGYQGTGGNNARAQETYAVPSVPLFMQERRALKFYARYCPEALPARVHPVVEHLFLTQAYTLVELHNSGMAIDSVRKELARTLNVKPFQIFEAKVRSRTDRTTVQRLLIKGLAPEQVKLRYAFGEAQLDVTKPGFVLLNPLPVSFDVDSSVAKGGRRSFKVVGVQCPAGADLLKDEIRPFIEELVSSGKLRVSNGPWRKAFVPIRDLSYEVENGAVTMRFVLRSGAYATTILGIIYNLEGDERTAQEDRALA